MDELTPLFALEAEQLLLSGFVEEAIDLCNKGLKVFPDYPTAKVILAKAYNLNGNLEQSEAVLNQAKSENYGKVLDKTNFNELPQLIDNAEVRSDVKVAMEVVEATDISKIEIDKLEEKTILLPQELENFNKEFINLIEYVETSIDLKHDGNLIENPSINISKHHIDSFNDEFINLIDSVGTSSIINNKKGEIVSQIETKKFINQEVTNSKKIDNLSEIKSKDLPINNTLSKILTKNKDSFFHQEDLSETIFKIEDSINSKINSIEKIEIKELPKVKIKFKSDSLENESTKVLVMGLINTRFIKSKNQKKFSEKTNELPIYTETMAKIFTSQGAKDKAINIYQKLMLNEPDKKDYYNSQIEKIK